MGTETDSIVFTINDTTGFSDPDTLVGAWHGIRYNNTLASNDSSKIVFCRLQYGKATGPELDKNGGAIFLYSYNKLLVSHSLIVNNISDGYGGGINHNSGSKFNRDS